MFGSPARRVCMHESATMMRQEVREGGMVLTAPEDAVDVGRHGLADRAVRRRPVQIVSFLCACPLTTISAMLCTLGRGGGGQLKRRAHKVCEQLGRTPIPTSISFRSRSSRHRSYLSYKLLTVGYSATIPFAIASVTRGNDASILMYVSWRSLPETTLSSDVPSMAMCECLRRLARDRQQPSIRGDSLLMRE